MLPSVSNLIHLGKEARKYFCQFLLYSPVCGYFISLFGFLLYIPVCSYFIALFVFLLYVPTFQTSWSNFNESKSAKDYIPLFPKCFQKLQTMIEKMIYHCLEKVPYKNFLPWKWHTTTTLGLKPSFVVGVSIPGK